MSDSFWLHGLQHARHPCPSLFSKVCSNSCPMSRWCHPTISSSVVPFSFCLQSFLASGSFPTCWLFASGGKNIGASAWASVLPMNIQGWFPWGLTGLISLLTKGLSRVFSNTTVQRHQFFSTQSILLSRCHMCTWLLEKSVLIIQTLVGKESVSGSQLAPTLDSACVSGLSPAVAAATSLPLKLCLEIPGSHPCSQSSSGQLCEVCAGPTPHNLNVDIAQGQCLEGRTNGGSLKANVSTSGLTSLYTDTLACSLIPQGRI